MFPINIIRVHIQRHKSEKCNFSVLIEKKMKSHCRSYMLLDIYLITTALEIPIKFSSGSVDIINIHGDSDHVSAKSLCVIYL